MKNHMSLIRVEGYAFEPDHPQDAELLEFMRTYNLFAVGSWPLWLLLDHFEMLSSAEHDFSPGDVDLTTMQPGLSDSHRFQTERRALNRARKMAQLPEANLFSRADTAVDIMTSYIDLTPAQVCLSVDGHLFVLNEDVLTDIKNSMMRWNPDRKHITPDLWRVVKYTQYGFIMSEEEFRKVCEKPKSLPESRRA